MSALRIACKCSSDRLNHSFESDELRILRDVAVVTNGFMDGLP